MTRRRTDYGLWIAEIRYAPAPDATRREESVFRILLSLLTQDETSQDGKQLKEARNGGQYGEKGSWARQDISGASGW